MTGSSSANAPSGPPADPSTPATVSFRCRHSYASGFVLDATFETDQQVTSITGPSGSGKSTILALIAGRLRPDAGCITTSGQALTDTATGAFVPMHLRGIGLLFQDHQLFPHLTVRANIEFAVKRRWRNPTPAGQAAASTALSADALVDSLQIREILGQYPRTLSGGQQQRVALARTLASTPSLLLLDEPLTAIDADLQAEIIDRLGQIISATRIPTILVSHNQALATELATKHVRLTAGTVVPADDRPL